MTHRLLALLVCFLFATEAFAVVPTILGAAHSGHGQSSPAMTSEHCAGMSQSHQQASRHTRQQTTQQADQQATSKGGHCPHCQDLATSSSVCASYCTVGL